MQQEKICSRLTSLSVIEKLLAAGILKDDRRGKYFHSLTYDEGFNFTGLASTILKSDVKEILSILHRFVYSEIPTGDKANRLFEQLVYYVDEAMREHYRQVAYEKKEEAISAASKRHRNISKRKKKKA